jgi:prolipoprotein diacylglyceryl transferase
VGAGVVGARAYHVATDWTRFDGRFLDVFAIWQGGLGIPGGLIAGISTGAFVAYRRGLPLARFVDAVLPGVPLGQAIGRWGNWFNQELFGRPTQVPWAIEIDPAHRPAQLARFATFHPTFLYESLWCAALVLALIWLDRRELLRRGHLIGAYLVGYGLGRLWIESLRVDPASRLLGMRVNMWSMSTALLIGLIICAAGLRRPAPPPATAALEREL